MALKACPSFHTQCVKSFECVDSRLHIRKWKHVFTLVTRLHTQKNKYLVRKYTIRTPFSLVLPPSSPQLIIQEISNSEDIIVNAEVNAFTDASSKTWNSILCWKRGTVKQRRVNKKEHRNHVPSCSIFTTSWNNQTCQSLYQRRGVGY